GIGGLGMKGYGCAGGSVGLLAFVQMEIARIDPSFATFFGVHVGLPMGSIYAAGSEEQKQKWLPPMARLEKIGCFGLTEPTVGSGAAGGLTTTAKRQGDTWVLNGQKKWIGNSPWCDLSIIWARDVVDNQVKGKMTDAHAALSKAFTTARMRETVAWGREILGGNGISLDYQVARYFADAEALYSYEGTYQMQNLIVGKAVTGLSAFV